MAMGRKWLGLGLLLGLVASAPAWCQTVGQLPNALQSFVDANGAPLAGGSVYFYIPSTTTPKTTWMDSGETTPNTNPVVLDSAGRAQIYGAGIYREVLKDQFGNLIWDKLTTDPSYFSSTYGSAITTLQGQVGTLTIQANSAVTATGTPATSGFYPPSGDVTALFQAMVNSAASVGGKVAIPCGHYNISSAISITQGNGIDIGGESQECVVINQTTANTPVFKFNAPGGLHSWKLHDMFLTSSGGNSVGSTGAIGVYFAGGSGVSYFNFQISNIHCDYLYRCMSDEIGSGAGAQARVWGFDIEHVWQEAHMLGAVWYSDSSVGEPRRTWRDIYVASGRGGSYPAWSETLFNPADPGDTDEFDQFEFNNQSCSSNTVTCMIYMNGTVTLSHVRAEAITMAGGSSLFQGPGGVAVATDVVVSLGTAVPNATLAYAFYLSGLDWDHRESLTIHGLTLANPIGAGELVGYAANNSNVVVNALDGWNNLVPASNNVSPTPIGVSGYSGSLVAPVANSDNWSQDTTCTISQTTGSVYLTWPMCKQYLVPNTLTGNLTVLLPSVTTGSGGCSSVNLIPGAVVASPGLTDVSFTRFHATPAAYTFQVYDCYSGRTLTGAVSDNASIDYRFVVGASIYGWVPYAQSMPLQ